jgi:hypothetical protein
MILKMQMQMQSFKYIVVFMAFVGFIQNHSLAQCGGSYVPDGDENYNCRQGGCCMSPIACNGPSFPQCHNYDPDFNLTGGCDNSCEAFVPIDNGILFLILGGGLFGGFLIQRNRKMQLISSNS